MIRKIQRKILKNTSKTRFVCSQRGFQSYVSGENYDAPNNQPTNKPTNRETVSQGSLLQIGAREINLPLPKIITNRPSDQLANTNQRNGLKWGFIGKLYFRKRPKNRGVPILVCFPVSVCLFYFDYLCLMAVVQS